MVLTRSVSGKEKQSTESGGTTDTPSTGETDNSGSTNTWSSGTHPTTSSEAPSGDTRTEAPADTSGIKVTPAASSIATVVDRQKTNMPPPTITKPTKPARSHRSKASSKRLLAELEAKERLAELELRRIRAEADLERIRQEREAAESSASELEDEEEDLASRRLDSWFNRHPEQTKKNEETGPRVEQPKKNEEAGPPPEQPKLKTREEEETRDRREYHENHSRPTSAMDVAALTTALTDAINASKSKKSFTSDLPTFSGYCHEWLQFKAAFNETSPSFAPSENVARIRKGLKGVALEAVSALLISQPRPEDIMNALERRYGRPDALLLGEMEKMKTLPRLTDNARDLCVFAGRIANTVATIELLKKPQYLYNPEVLRIIVEKLTPILRNKWYDYAADKEDKPELKKIAEFLNREADRCAPFAPPEQTSEKTIKKKPERAYAATAVANPRRNAREKTSCPLCNLSHQLPTCPQFNKVDTNERWEIAKRINICYRCLVSNHRRFMCRAKPCGHNGCPMRHHRLLHHERTSAADATATPADQPSPQSEQVMAAAAPQQVASAAAERNRARAYLKIAPVTLRGPRATIDAYALLDDGSTVTIIEAPLADALGLEGPTEPMRVLGVGGAEMTHKASKKVNVAIKGRHSHDELQLSNARTVARLDFSSQSVNENELEDCPHLERIKNELLYENATPQILIGQDNWEFLVSHEIKKGRRDQLVASRTLLGWVLHGCRTSHATPVAYCCAHLSEAKPTDDIEEAMKKYFALESLSIEPRKQKSDPELQALNILEKRSRRLPDGRYETGLLWKEEDNNIPNNRTDALRRLHTLERKLDRNEALKKQYNERIENLLRSNYAERAAAPPSGKTWYLPHFAVCNPEKPKIRVVHDAAAKSHGRSLNDMLLPGPDFLQSLPGVIMRFRQHRIAVSADIKEMFMQVKIRMEDRDALRFLWRGNRREGEADEYRMSSLIFGASSSPCTALYIKNRNAREHADEYPEAARAIEKNHYMDDYLQSFLTVDEANRTTRDVDHVHKQTGFQLRGWATNETAAIADVNKSEREGATTNECKREGTTVSIGGSEIEKTLGLLWNTKEDCIRFRLNTRKAPPEVLSGARPPTKREALSIIMSVFDPLGLISTITTPAKRILQETWRYKTDWDEALPEELHERWSGWLRRLHDLGDLSIPRCYDVEPAVRYELHTFTDASEEAYAAAVYWRMTRPDGSIKVALAAAKSRVTPTKPISVPRLELQAAVLGVRLAKSVADEHEYEVAQKIYWSDSRTAMAWYESST